jgi:hypothetical protein
VCQRTLRAGSWNVRQDCGKCSVRVADRVADLQTYFWDGEAVAERATCERQAMACECKGFISFCTRYECLGKITEGNVTSLRVAMPSNRLCSCYNCQGHSSLSLASQHTHSLSMAAPYNQSLPLPYHLHQPFISTPPPPLPAARPRPPRQRRPTDPSSQNTPTTTEHDRLSGLRASVLETAIGIGFGNNNTVAKWIFSNPLAEEDEEDDVRPPPCILFFFLYLLIAPRPQHRYPHPPPRPHPTPSSQKAFPPLLPDTSQTQSYNPSPPYVQR